MKLLEILDAAAQALTNRHTDEWPGLVVYILEALQEHTGRETYEAMLVQLQAEIAERLGAGRW